jgi:hypothetical protein
MMFCSSATAAAWRVSRLAVAFGSIVLSGCSGDDADRAAPSPIGPAAQYNEGPGARLPRKLTPAEEAKLRQIEAILPGADDQHIRQSLTDHRVFRIEVSNPRVQAILDQIYAARRQSDEADAAREEAESRKQRAMTTVALMEEWAEPGVSAVVVRRPREEQGDIILMPSSATAATLGTAIRALAQIRTAEATRGQRDLRVEILGESLPSSWRTSGLDQQATAMLGELRSRPLTTLRNIGRARTTLIPISLR